MCVFTCSISLNNTDMTRNLHVGGLYHVYNFGVDGRDIFSDPLDSFRFTKALEYFNTTSSTKFFELFKDEHGLSPRTRSLRKREEEQRDKPEKLVSIIAFCLNTDHFHIVLRQEVEGGVALFMRKLSVGYTNYFNKRYKRRGALFQGRYKSEYIEPGADLQYVSAYVNLNNHVHDLEGNSHICRSSMRDYVNPDNAYGFVATSDVLYSFGGSREEYMDFAQETVQFIIDTREHNKNFLRKELHE